MKMCCICREDSMRMICLQYKTFLFNMQNEISEIVMVDRFREDENVVKRTFPKRHILCNDCRKTISWRINEYVKADMIQIVDEISSEEFIYYLTLIT